MVEGRKREADRQTEKQTKMHKETWGRRGRNGCDRQGKKDVQWNYIELERGRENRDTKR